MASRYESFGIHRWALFLLLSGLLIVAFWVVATLEPMRWRLPIRYLFGPIDIYREGVFDYTMCMRVPLSREEADRFIARQFPPETQVPRPVPVGVCPAPFWPKSFTTKTRGYAETLWSNGMVEGSTGAVLEGGYLYYWDYTQ